MRRCTVPCAVFGLVLMAALALSAPVASPPPASSSQPQADLAWFMTGLRDLGKSRDSRLKLLPAQAKKILPILEKLVAEKILITEVPKMQGRLGERPSGNPGGGAPGRGSLTEKQRQELQARQQKTAELMRKSIDSMDGMLRQAQSDYILGLDFDPALYGLGRFRAVQGQWQGQGSGQQQQRPSQAEIQKLMKARQEAISRLVKLNREVLEMLKKLASS